PEAELRRIERERLGNLVELNLLAEAALRGAVAPLGSARRLVREDPAALKLICGNVIRDRLQGAGIESAGDAVRSVRAAVEHRLHVHPGDRAVALDAGLEMHQDRMAAAMAIEHFFAGQTDLHGAVEQQGRPRDDDFMVERVALAAEAAAVRRRNDADMRRGHGERLRQRPMYIVRRWRAGP